MGVAKDPLFEDWQLWAIGSAVVVALGAFLSTAMVSKRARVVSIAVSELGKSNALRYSTASGGRMPSGTSWCGIFALWSLRKAGLTEWDWEWQVGFLSKLPRTKNPKPGDIAYKHEPYRHQAVVEKVEGGTIWTINGNSDNGKVVRKRGPISDWTAFYSIQPLIDGCRERTCLSWKP